MVFECFTIRTKSFDAYEWYLEVKIRPLVAFLEKFGYRCEIGMLNGTVECLQEDYPSIAALLKYYAAERGFYDF